MKKIIGIIHPFDLQQIFYVYQDGNRLDIMKVRIDKIPEAVLRLAETYDAYQVDLSGAKEFSKGIIEKIKQEEMRQYNINKIEIKCI